MDKNKTDIFEINSQNPFETTQESNDNFFLFNEPIHEKTFRPEPSRRLNDYDSNLLKEGAYKDISDDLFKLEYKISKIEDELKEIDSQIQAANDIHDYNTSGELSGRKLLLEEELRELVEIYNDKSISARISDGISNVFGGKLKNNLSKFHKTLSLISESILNRLPKRFSTIFELKKSLAKLENINKSVDELMSMNIPYGETYDKYERLSKYIIKANAIQSNISGHIK